MSEKKSFQEQANEYGRRIVESCREELEALEHSSECDGTDDAGNPCEAGKGKENPSAWHDTDAAQEAIYESPLEVKADAGERFDGTRRYMILLGTGGPASRITGRLDDSGHPETAEFEYQDWGEPWTPAELSREEEATLLEWARKFSFEMPEGNG